MLFVLIQLWNPPSQPILAKSLFVIHINPHLLRLWHMDVTECQTLLLPQLEVCMLHLSGVSSFSFSWMPDSYKQRAKPISLLHVQPSLSLLYLFHRNQGQPKPRHRTPLTGSTTSLSTTPANSTETDSTWERHPSPWLFRQEGILIL